MAAVSLAKPVAPRCVSPEIQKSRSLENVQVDTNFRAVFQLVLLARPRCWQFHQVGIYDFARKVIPDPTSCCHLLKPPAGLVLVRSASISNTCEPCQARPSPDWIRAGAGIRSGQTRSSGQPRPRRGSWSRSGSSPLCCFTTRRNLMKPSDATSVSLVAGTRLPLTFQPDPRNVRITSR
jgi:hypothetical protein